MGAIRLASLVLAAAAGALVAPASADPPRNILLLIADDMGVDRVGAYAEHPDPGRTPVIDSLAANGVLFRNAWSNPVCSPSRAALLTGRHCFRTGFGFGTNWFITPTELSPNEVTLPDVLPPAYTSLALGKWHLGSKKVSGALHPNLCGFDHFKGSMTVLAGGPTDNYFNWPKISDGVSSQSTKYVTTEGVDDALAFIHGTPEPWFVWLSFHSPHGPFHKPPAHLHTYSLPPLIDDSTTPIHMKAMAEAMDTEIGRLLQGMPPAVRANTVVVFVADNGTDKVATTAPFSPAHAKGTLYEGGINVPLIVSGPGVASGAECGAIVNTTDLFATIAEIAGAAPVTAEDSISLVPYFSNPALPSLRSHAYSEFFSPNDFGAYTFRLRAVRDQRYKLMYSYDHSTTPNVRELYDLQADPFELQNLLAGRLTAEQQTALAALEAQLYEPYVPWQSLARPTAGTLGPPLLTGVGALTPNAVVTLTLSQTLPGSNALLLIGTENVGMFAMGGIVCTLPILAIGLTTADPTPVTFQWPKNSPPGVSLIFQYWIQDPGAPLGWAVSNGLAANTP
jgi:arylsulfatase A-like enzyme